MLRHAHRVSARVAALMLSIIGVAGLSPYCHGAEAASARRYDFKIGSMPLDQALQEFARQSGLQVLFLSHLTDGRQGPELAGEYTLAAAMERLLQDSGLSFRVVDPQTIEVRPPAVVAHGEAREPPAAPVSVPIQEVTVLGRAEQLVATRVPTALQDIPQSISIVAPEQIRLQNAADLSDVLRNATGIIVNRTTSLSENYYARGFETLAIHVDGGASLDPTLPVPLVFVSSLDLSEFERVEILRGSDGLFASNANPGATVSLVRKRTLPEYQMELSAVVGSWDTRRFEADVTGPINADGSLRARADLVYARNDYFFSTANFERKKVFGVVEYDVTPRATLTAGGSIQWDDAVPWEGGLPFNQDGSDAHAPRDTALTYDWAYQRMRMSETYLQYRQQFGDGWNLRFNATHWQPRIESDYAVIYELTGDSAMPSTATTNAFPSGKPTDIRQNTADVTVTGVLNWLGLREQVVFGADFRHFAANWNQYWVIAGPSQSLRNFNPHLYGDPRSRIAKGLEMDGVSMLSQHGVFASARIELNAAWAVTVGARLATDEQTTRFWNDPNSSAYEPGLTFGSSNILTPYLGAVYKLNEHYSWYASYADIYLSYAGQLGEWSGSAHGINLETGVKGVWRDGALHSSLALFRTQQRDLAGHGRAESRGAELEINGELQPGWLMGAGYTYNEWREPSDGLLYPMQSPRHLLKLWTSLQLPDRLSRWTLGGTVAGQTHLDVSGWVCFGGGCDVTQKSHAVLDLRAAYQIDRNWQMALNVNNVFDKTYYDSIEPYYARAFYGPPRNLMLRVDAKF